MSRRRAYGLLALLSLIVLACGCGEKPATGEKPPLLCYVGGTMRPAIEELAQMYEKETGQKVEINYADSGALMIMIEQTGKGDLYVCHDPFQALLMKKGLGDKGWTVASVTPAICVLQGNPKAIKGIKDLARKDLKIGLTDAQYSTCGHITPVMLRKAGLPKEIEEKAVRTRSGGEMANNVALGHLDAAIVWDAVIAVRKGKVEAVGIEPEYRPDPKVDAVTTATFGLIDMSYVKVTIATLKCSKRLDAARKFAEFVNSPRGRAVFTARGFSPVHEESKATAAEGKGLYLYCGAGLQPAVSELIDAFTKETGVRVEADYAGSGPLISRIKLSGRGDVFMPGDIQYIETAEKENLMQSKKTACYFIPVILVPKGNPKKVQTLQDLTKPGVRLGLGNPEACAVGKTCEKIFEKNGIQLDDVKKNLKYSSPTVNELGLQIKTGNLDAVIVWDAMAAYYRDCADAVAIPPQQNVNSHVAIGALNCSKNQALANRFVDFVTGEKGREIFKKHNYTTTLPK